MVAGCALRANGGELLYKVGYIAGQQEWKQSRSVNIKGDRQRLALKLCHVSVGKLGSKLHGAASVSCVPHPSCLLHTLEPNKLNAKK